jgi:acyl-CoA thioesterase II
MMETALIDHIADGFFPTMIFSLNHQVYFHSNFNINEWLLYECISPIAGENIFLFTYLPLCLEDGRAYAEGRCWTMDGRLVMSMSQEGIVRYSKKEQLIQKYGYSL